MPHRWTIQDSATSEIYEFVTNPNEGGSPERSKNIEYQSTTNGPTVVFEGRDQPLTISFNGVVLTEAEYNTMITWFNKRRQILLTDDLGRQMWIYITRFSPTRGWKFHHPGRHTYSIDAIVLEEV